MVSIIIPAYNASKTIEKSVRSILSQSYNDIEVIVIDDGSKDNTSDIVHNMLSFDSRLKLFSVENGGPAKARNLALDKVSSKSSYIMFCDADDEYVPDAIEKAVKEAENGSDFVIFGFTIVNSDGTRNFYSEPSGCYSRENFGNVYGNLYKANLLNQVWGKLFSAELINTFHIRFPDYRWGEDRLFVIEVLEHFTQVSVISDCLYLYNIQPGESLVSGFYDKKIEVCIETDKKIETLRNEFGVVDDRYFKYMFVKSVFSALVNLYTPGCRLNSKQKYNYIRQTLSNDYVVSHISGVESGPAASLVCDVMKSGNVYLNALAARSVAYLGKTMPKVFQNIKHKK